MLRRRNVLLFIIVQINEVLKPSETQQEMVSSFADRAEQVRNGNVNPKIDNISFRRNGFARISHRQHPGVIRSAAVAYAGSLLYGQRVTKSDSQTVQD